MGGAATEPVLDLALCSSASLALLIDITESLFAIVHKRATASIHGSHNLCSGSRRAELHNSHFITTFRSQPVYQVPPAVLRSKQVRGQLDMTGKWLQRKRVRNSDGHCLSRSTPPSRRVSIHWQINAEKAASG